MFRKYIKYLSVILILNLMLFSGVLSVNSDDKGSITVTVISQDDDNGTRVDRHISGVVFKVYQVWTYKFHDDGNKIILGESLKGNGLLTLEDVGISINSSMSEDEIQKTASKFVEKVANAIPYIESDPTNNSGTTIINDLPQGGYLFIQKEPIVWHGKKYTMSPFLVTVPRLVDGKYELDVNAYPKPSLKRSWKYEPPKTGVE